MKRAPQPIDYHKPENWPARIKLARQNVINAISAYKNEPELAKIIAKIKPSVEGEGLESIVPAALACYEAEGGTSNLRQELYWVAIGEIWEGAA